jgi:long-subunit fatty acid transport protein
MSTKKKPDRWERVADKAVANYKSAYIHWDEVVALLSCEHLAVLRMIQQHRMAWRDGWSV